MRVEIPYTVEKTAGGNLQPVSGASVQVNVRGGGAALVYATETGGSPVSNPLTTDPKGEIAAWAEEGSYDLVVSGSGITTRSVPIELTRGDALVSIATAKLGDASVSTVKLVDGSVTTAKIGNAQITSAKLAAGVPPMTGEIKIWPVATVPTGWLLCDGSAVAIASYGALYAVIGTTFGGTGPNFNLPDLRGRFPVGKGTHTDVDVLGDNDGLSIGSRTPKHTHGVSSDGGHSHVVDAHGHSRSNHLHAIARMDTSAAQGGSIGGSISGVPASPTAHTHFIPQDTYTTGGGGAGYSDPASPNTNAVGGHTHGGATGVGYPGFVTVNFLIKT